MWCAPDVAYPGAIFRIDNDHDRKFKRMHGQSHQFTCSLLLITYSILRRALHEHSLLEVLEGEANYGE